MALLNDDLELSKARDIPISGMLIAATPLLFVTGMSMYLRLGNARTIIISACRCVAQLLALGLVLYPIFRENEAYISVPYVVWMAMLATREACAKPKHWYLGMRRHAGVGVVASVGIWVCVLSAGVVRPTPLYDAQVVIPVAGMMLGSCVNAVSLGMDRFLLSLASGGRALTFQACGATPWETSLPALREGLETGLTPNLNQMSVMGLVSIPGMYTGQLLSGTSPLVAAKYQIVIMFFSCSNSAVILFLTMAQAVSYALFRPQIAAFHAAKINRRKPGKPQDILLATARFIFSFLPTPNNNTHQTQNKSLNKPITTGRFTLIHPPSHPTTEPLLQLTQAHLSLHNTNRTLHDIHLHLHPQQIILLEGKSGCGKSTFLRALALLEPMNYSSFALNGRSPLVHLTPSAWRSQVLYVRQNAGQGLTGTPESLLKSIFQFQIQMERLGKELPSSPSSSSSSQPRSQIWKDLTNHMTQVELLPEMIHQPWEKLSGGEAQRMYLCLMISLRPTILLLDEPTSACDEHSARLVEQLVVQSNLAAVWVSHDVNQMERLNELDQVVCMKYEEDKEDLDQTQMIATVNEHDMVSP